MHNFSEGAFPFVECRFNVWEGAQRARKETSECDSTKREQSRPSEMNGLCVQSIKNILLVVFLKFILSS